MTTKLKGRGLAYAQSRGRGTAFPTDCWHYHLLMTGGTDFHGMYSKVMHPFGVLYDTGRSTRLIEKMADGIGSIYEEAL